MISQAVTTSCSDAFEKREHICFGISPFNSYFSEARIQELAQWGKSEFRSMHFFVPDVPSVFTLEALGYDTEKAAWKARRQAQNLFNKITKALSTIGIDSISAHQMILNWESLTQNSTYVSSYKNTLALFEVDPGFREACMDATAWVLEGRLAPGTTANEVQKAHAVKYLLAEIPLFIDTVSIVSVSSSVFSYHQCIAFIADLIGGKFHCKRNPDQGFVVLRPTAGSFNN